MKVSRHIKPSIGFWDTLQIVLWSTYSMGVGNSLKLFAIIMFICIASWKGGNTNDENWSTN